MTDVINDFNKLYEKIEYQFSVEFYLNCNDKSNNTCTVKFLQERRSYFCCAVDDTNRCILHKCIPVIFGTKLDLRFRRNDVNKSKDFNGTFMIDGRNLSFPNIMMNNNILVHKFYDKRYPKHCKRMFLYGNVDEEKKINRAIQLVYNQRKNVLFARDVYASDYVVTKDLNTILEIYLKKSGKWEPVNFIFDYDKHQRTRLVEQIKRIMATDINYSIDNLANKIIYKHDYLLWLMFEPIFKNYSILKKKERDCYNGTTQAKKRKLQTILFPKECKKIVDSIVNGKLIYVVSKTFSKQKKSFVNHQDNSSNNNIEIVPPTLKYRIGNEVVRITGDTTRQDMLMQKSDFIKFVDSFLHGEMTVAGKKFFLCRNVRLPSVDYSMIADKFKLLEREGVFVRCEKVYNNNNNNNADIIEIKQNIDQWLEVAFNNRPTIFLCKRSNLRYIFYILKHDMCPIELKLANNILFVNHHEGMVGIKRVIHLGAANIITLLTPYEYHNSQSILRSADDIGYIKENDDVCSLTSKLIQYYYRNYMNIFSTIPVPKLIVSLTNLKNAMPVIGYNETMDKDLFLNSLPTSNCVVVDKRLQINNKMFKLWTLVRDNKLMTAEDPYIPDCKLPIRLYNNKVNKLKGKLVYSKHENPTVKYYKSETNNFAVVEGGNVLYMAGVVVSNVKIAWIYDGKRYKIEPCRNKNFYVNKIYIYFRQINNQSVERLDSSLVVTNDTVYLKITMIISTGNLDGVKICGIHGQKGVINGAEDLTEWMAEDGTCAQICLSPISYLSRQTNFDDVEIKYVVRGGDFTDLKAKRYPIFNIPYMFFNNTPDNIFKEFIKSNHTGHEKVEGTRLDQWTINQSFAGNRWAESLQYVRGGSNLPDDNGEYKVMASLLHCNNIIVTQKTC